MDTVTLHIINLQDEGKEINISMNAATVSSNRTTSSVVSYVKRDGAAMAMKLNSVFIHLVICLL